MNKSLCGGEGGIRTHVGPFEPHPISSRRRYDRFGTSPIFATSVASTKLISLIPFVVLQGWDNNHVASIRAHHWEQQSAQFRDHFLNNFWCDLRTRLKKHPQNTAQLIFHIALSSPSKK